MWLWTLKLIREHWRRGLVALAWLTLVLLGEANLQLLGGTNQGLQELVAEKQLLTERVTELKFQVMSLEEEIQRLKEENAFLRACIETLGQPRAPWEGIECPKPEPEPPDTDGGDR